MVLQYVCEHVHTQLNLSIFFLDDPGSTYSTPVVRWAPLDPCRHVWRPAVLALASFVVHLLVRTLLHLRSEVPMARITPVQSQTIHEILHLTCACTFRFTTGGSRVPLSFRPSATFQAFPKAFSYATVFLFFPLFGVRSFLVRDSRKRNKRNARIFLVSCHVRRGKHHEK